MTLIISPATQPHHRVFSQLKTTAKTPLAANLHIQIRYIIQEPYFHFPIIKPRLNQDVTPGASPLRCWASPSKTNVSVDKKKLD
jgi:hypothetical protein